jgi:hypothetical protein
VAGFPLGTRARRSSYVIDGASGIISCSGVPSVAIFQVKSCKPQVLTFYRDFLKGSTRAGDFKAVFKTV